VVRHAPVAQGVRHRYHHGRAYILLPFSFYCSNVSPHKTNQAFWGELAAACKIRCRISCSRRSTRC
jgi:hypothetical protein